MLSRHPSTVTRSGSATGLASRCATVLVRGQPGRLRPHHVPVTAWQFGQRKRRFSRRLSKIVLPEMGCIQAEPRNLAAQPPVVHVVDGQIQGPHRIGIAVATRNGFPQLRLWKGEPSMGKVRGINAVSSEHTPQRRARTTIVFWQPEKASRGSNAACRFRGDSELIGTERQVHRFPVESGDMTDIDSRQRDAPPDMGQRPRRRPCTALTCPSFTHTSRSRTDQRLIVRTVTPSARLA